MEDTEDKIDWRRPTIADFIWDMFPHELPLSEHRKIQDSLGLVPSDDDGLLVLHLEADKRRAKMLPINEKLAELTPWAAEVVSEYAVRSLAYHGANVSDIPPGLREAFTSQSESIIGLAVAAIISHLIDTEVLAYGKKL